MNDLDNALEQAIREEMEMDEEEEIIQRRDQVYDIEGEGQYMVVTSKQAHDMAEDYIANSLWAFRPEYIADVLDVDYDVLRDLADNGACEQNNRVVRHLVDSKANGFVRLVVQAIHDDGLGHFLAPYDGQEVEVWVDRELYYLFRVN